jgi:hypothetical protein
VKTIHLPRAFCRSLFLCFLQCGTEYPCFLAKNSSSVHSLYTPFMPSELFGFIHDVAGSHGGVMDEEGTSHPLEPVLHLNGRPLPPPPPPPPACHKNRLALTLTRPWQKLWHWRRCGWKIKNIFSVSLTIHFTFYKKISNTKSFFSDPSKNFSGSDLFHSSILFYSIHFHYFLLSPLWVIILI